MRKTKGFTLIEILVVVAIICVLMAFVLPGLMGSKARSNEKMAKAEIRQFETALDMFYVDNGVFPAHIDGTYSSSALLKAFKGSAETKNYYSFKKGRIRGEEYFSPLDNPYFYRNNHSQKTKTSDMFNPDRFDIWTKDRLGEEKGVNNWD